MEFRKLNLRIARSKTVPHVLALQECNLFRSLDFHSFISSCGYKLLIRSAIVFLCSLVSVIKFHSTGFHSTSHPNAPCTGCPSLNKWYNPIILPGLIGHCQLPQLLPLLLLFVVLCSFLINWMMLTKYFLI